MKFFQSALLPVFGLPLFVQANPITVAIATDVSFAPMTYTGPITPGGENVTLHGTAKGIHDQIIELNPAFNPNEFEVVRKRNAELAERVSVGRACNINTPGYTFWADPQETQTNINYLNGLPGACGAGGHQASRLSCVDKSAIYMVNNNNFFIAAQCQWLAGFAQDILDHCYGTNFVNGQESDSQNYVVIVAGTTC